MKLEFFQHIVKKCSVSNFMKIHPVGAELFMWTDRLMDRQTDRHDEADGHFSPFCVYIKKFGHK